MSDWIRTRAGQEFISAVKMIAKELKRANDLKEEELKKEGSQDE